SSLVIGGYLLRELPDEAPDLPFGNQHRRDLPRIQRRPITPRPIPCRPTPRRPIPTWRHIGVLSGSITPICLHVGVAGGIVRRHAVCPGCARGRGCLVGAAGPGPTSGR